MNLLGKGFNLARKYIKSDTKEEQESKDQKDKDVAELNKKVKELLKEKEELIGKFKVAQEVPAEKKCQIQNALLMMEEDKALNSELYSSYQQQAELLKQTVIIEDSSHIADQINVWKQALSKQDPNIIAKVKQYARSPSKEEYSKTLEKSMQELVETSLAMLDCISELSEQNDLCIKERSELSSFKEQLKRSAEEQRRLMNEKIDLLKDDNNRIKEELNSVAQFKELYNQQLEKSSSLESTITNSKKTIAKDNESIAALNNENNKLKDQLTSLQEDYVNCKLKYDEIVSANLDQKKQIDYHKSEINKLNIKIKESDEIADMNQKLTKSNASKDAEIKLNTNFIHNLQNTLNAANYNHDSVVKAKELEIAELKAKIEKLTHSLLEVEQCKKQIAQLTNNIGGLNAQISDEKSKYNVKLIEIVELQKCIEDLRNGMKQVDEEKKHQVDRRMINAFLVNYLNPSLSQVSRKEMLNSMCKVLEFTKEQRQALGLDDKPMAQQFLDFLLKKQ